MCACVCVWTHFLPTALLQLVVFCSCCAPVCKDVCLLRLHAGISAVPNIIESYNQRTHKIKEPVEK